MPAKAQRLLYNMEEKSILRKEISARKKQFSSEQLNSWSEQIMEKLSTTDLFQQARCIAIYHALPQEVQTAVFIEKWYQQKKLALPLVQGDDLLFLPYTGKDSIQKGSFGILEPIVTKDSESVESEIDLIVVPGVAFDRQHNRMGRGRGFYDRLLSTLHVPTIGICFDFQLLAEIPTEPFDKKMDLIITENEIIE